MSYLHYTEARCMECGGEAAPGEAFCGECLSDHIGGRCIYTACPERAWEDGLCKAHAIAERESYRKLYDEMYCEHGIERNTDGCSQCDYDPGPDYDPADTLPARPGYGVYCMSCGHLKDDEGRCDCARLGGERMARLAGEMARTETRWRMHSVRFGQNIMRRCEHGTYSWQHCQPCEDDLPF